MRSLVAVVERLYNHRKSEEEKLAKANISPICNLAKILLASSTNDRHERRKKAAADHKRTREE